MNSAGGKATPEREKRPEAVAPPSPSPEQRSAAGVAALQTRFGNAALTSISSSGSISPYGESSPASSDLGNAAIAQALSRNGQGIQAEFTVSTPSSAAVLDDAAERQADEMGAEVAAEVEPAAVAAGRLPESIQAVAERRVGIDLGVVILKSDLAARRRAVAHHARAVTDGTTIDFAPGELSQGSTNTRQLLGHELIHVAQQRARDGATSQSPSTQALARPNASIQAKPAELIEGFSFCGRTVGGGINSTLRKRLEAVERHLRGNYNAIPADQRIAIGGDPLTFEAWAGVHSIRGWRSGSSTSKHASGSAVDVNYDLQPYIVTRTGATLGGERAGASLVAQRQRAAEVYDRATRYTFGAGQAADVSARRAGESAGQVYDRFRNLDVSLSHYLSRVFLQDPTAVMRRPLADVEAASESDLLRAIPLAERRPEADVVRDLTGQLPSGWPLDARQTYFRILRDFEHVRIPMVRGNPVARPTNTRNPSRGFLDMSRDFVVAMMDIGRLRWGAADLGDAESGDIHHFDLGTHGGVTPDGTP